MLNICLAGTMMQKSSIYLSHVSKKYGKHNAVRDITFSVRPGEISAFLGPNGAGKSTTMKMLAALLAPTSGTIFVEGYSMRKEREQIKRLVGVVFQEDVLDRELTVFQNLYYRGSLYYTSKCQVLKRVKAVTDTLFLEPLLSKCYGSCSGGQKRLCQIGRTLMADPRLLLLDEPTTGLDPIARETVWHALFLLNQKYGKTIFFTTHDMVEADYASHICMMKRGRIMVCGEKSRILQQYGRKGCHTVQKIYMDLLREDYEG